MTTIRIASIVLTLASLAFSQSPNSVHVDAAPGDQTVLMLATQRRAQPMVLGGIEGMLRLDPAGSVFLGGGAAGSNGRSTTGLPRLDHLPVDIVCQVLVISPNGHRFTSSFLMNRARAPLQRVSDPTPIADPLALDNGIGDGEDVEEPVAIRRVLASGRMDFFVAGGPRVEFGGPVRGSPGDQARLLALVGDESGQVGPSPEAFSTLTLAGSLTTFPRSANCKLFNEYPSGAKRVGSAALIDPRHALTAGHCVYEDSRGGWVEWLQLAPAYDDGDEPFGHSTALEVFAWSGWTDSENYKHDIAIVRLNRPVGALTGWFGYGYSNSCSFYKTNTFHTFGYPADGGYDGSDMYYADGDFESCPTKWEARMHTESFGGQSGSGIYRKDSSGDRYVHAVLSHAPGAYPRRTDVVRLRDSKFADVQDWLADARPSSPDLTPLDVRLVSGSSTVNAGDSIDIDFLLLNYSSADRSGSFSYKIMRSDDDQITTSDDVLVSTVSTGFRLDAMATARRSHTVRIPSSTPSGTHHIGVILVSSDAKAGNQHTLAQDVLEIRVR